MLRGLYRIWDKKKVLLVKTTPPLSSYLCHFCSVSFHTAGITLFSDNLPCACSPIG